MLNQANLIDKALSEVESMVKASGNKNDLTYFMYHKKRFRVMAATVTSMCKEGGTILDIGSHYQHSSVLLTLLGYKVASMDVGEFLAMPLIQARIQQHGITAIQENDLEKLTSLSDTKEAYDLILFTEILEHITFNPIAFWQRIHEVIKDQGYIYVTTPNSLTLYNIFRTIANLLTLRGIGIGVNSILSSVTYGHHWKEYSASEIRHYFTKLSDGFAVSIKKFQYQHHPPQNRIDTIRVLLLRIGNGIPFFKEAIEAVIQVDKSKPWKMNAPEY
ncbi:MAG: methyltransferase domain-containing protein [Bacteroidota bacterium]|nr:methyltransferase domain-containing protein [Bacteroidota bacterium]